LPIEPFENTSHLLLSVKRLKILFEFLCNGAIIFYLILLNEETRLKMFLKPFKALMLFSKSGKREGFSPKRFF
jgi:hypothetical protein